MNAIARTGALICALALAGCATQPAPPVEPPDTRAADEAAIRADIAAWAAAAQAKDAERFVSAYADDAVLMLEGVPDVSGMVALREGVAGMMQDPHFALSFAPDKVVVARSGDLAYETGSYSLTMTGPDAAPVTQAGHYVVVWRKQADGTWKAVVDAPVSDPPDEPESPQGS